MAEKYAPWQLVLLNFFRFLCFVIGLGIGITYGMNLYYLFKALINGADFLDLWFLLLLNLYGIFFALIVVMVEFRSDFILQHFPSMLEWGKRGLFYAFNGLLSLGMGAANSSFPNVDNDEAVRKTQEYTAYIIIILGAFDLLGAVLCLQSNAQNMRERFNGENSHKVSSIV
eukprot:CAMPEP_0204843224 /NCGR_PEP_ID=MMETSP1346-20131115/47857_1 /ASSEMBLY_ACC=CAM_ASM_000771 /TAXON_ID=215587 /ORGANISM="Aplanochytrium stocchinoi, Strain GSBS06" /LENGTH=170 /DNA_ID=CAMNT_0051982337 /DNA_START=80 /DNA_END=592 /DNA_ORIENTATION=+